MPELPGPPEGDKVVIVVLNCFELELTKSAYTKSHMYSYLQLFTFQPFFGGGRGSTFFIKDILIFWWGEGPTFCIKDILIFWWGRGPTFCIKDILIFWWGEGAHFLH